jgi:hypothetical protein
MWDTEREWKLKRAGIDPWFKTILTIAMSNYEVVYDYKRKQIVQKLVQDKQ